VSSIKLLFCLITRGRHWCKNWSRSACSGWVRSKSYKSSQ